MTRIIKSNRRFEEKSSYQYSFSNIDITALNADWKCLSTFEENLKEDNYESLWTSPPKENNCYDIRIIGLITLDIHQNFWVLHWNKEGDIESIGVCRCECIELIEIGDEQIRLKVNVLQTIPLREIDKQPNNSITFGSIKEGIFDNDCDIEKIGNYAHVFYSIQGFGGYSYLLKINKKSVTCLLEGNWSYSGRAIWTMPNQELYYHSDRMNKLRE
jgi:hypothetical protein